MDFTNQLWIARDKSGELYLYDQEPERQEDCFISCLTLDKAFCISEVELRFSNIMQLDRRLYPDVRWENSPQLLNAINQQ